MSRIVVNTTKASDQLATIDIEPKGTGVVLHVRVKGQRGGVRTEELGMTSAMRTALITALGGTP